MKEMKYGRKPLPKVQKQEALKRQKERVKIANLVARKPELQKICCICGKTGHILHNRNNPYFITFICNECDKDKNKLLEAEDYRFDLRLKLNKPNLNTRNFVKEEVENIVEGYLIDKLSIGDYCDKREISRYQFTQLIKRYENMYPEREINETIISHSNEIMGENCKKRYIERKMLKDKEEIEYINSIEKEPLTNFQVKFGKVLLELVKNKSQNVIYYSDINEKFNNTLSRKMLGYTLGIFSKLCYEKLGLPFISGNVVRKDTLLPR